MKNDTERRNRVEERRENKNRRAKERITIFRNALGICVLTEWMNSLRLVSVGTRV